MTRCPNCGSAIRIGAKFCTSCGFRLTVDEPATASTASPSRSPFSTTSTAAWSAGPAETPPPGEATAAEDDVVEPAWAKADDEDEYEDEDEDEDDGRIVDVRDAAGVSSTDEVFASDDQLILLKDEPTGGSEQPEPSWFSPPAPDTSGPVSDDMVAALGGDHDDQLQADIASDTDADAPVAVEHAPVAEALRTTYSWNPDDQQITAVRDAGAVGTSAAMPAAPTASPGGTDPLAEARSLVVRLSDVLATIQSGGGGGTSAVSAPTSIANESDVDALRSIVKAAQERPRDVDVMLDLVLRADTIAAVLTDRDLLLAALRGDEAAVEETWAQEEDEPSTYPAWRALP